MQHEQSPSFADHFLKKIERKERSCHAQKKKDMQGDFGAAAPGYSNRHQ
ncbi:MAG: hypothetical protein PHZ02_04350 [Desulfocapsaceae bacterium]|nr:hypothetical protein [Desulfocapsaceae bacterium]